MPVLLNQDSRVLIQGFGGAGQREAATSLAFGTNVVCGVTPGRGGQVINDLPVLNTVREGVEEFDANVSLIFVPAPFAADAIIEAADAGVPTAICITEGIPTLDMVKAKAYLQQSNTRLIGPNCPGVISVSERARAGIMPIDVYAEGNVGVISRSGTLVYETVDQLTRLGIGQSSSVGVGGDPIIGTSQREALELFQADADTAAVVLIGEIGGTAEQEAADYISGMMKPSSPSSPAPPHPPAAAWATPARSSRARPAPPPPSSRRCARPARRWSSRPRRSVPRCCASSKSKASPSPSRSAPSAGEPVCQGGVQPSAPSRPSRRPAWGGWWLSLRRGLLAVFGRCPAQADDARGRKASADRGCEAEAPQGFGQAGGIYRTLQQRRRRPGCHPDGRRFPYESTPIPSGTHRAR